MEHLRVRRTLDLLMHKRVVDGDEAARLGLVTEAVDDDQLMPRALELAADLAEEPQVATRLLKRAVHNAAHLFDEAGDHIGSKSATATSTTRAKGRRRSSSGARRSSTSG